MPNPVLRGKARKILDKAEDLVALKTPVDNDFLSRFLQQHWPVTVSRSSSLIQRKSFKAHQRSRASFPGILSIELAALKSALSLLPWESLALWLRRSCSWELLQDSI
jgi:hypothetical protein